MSDETELVVEWLTDELEDAAPGGAWEDVPPADTAYPFISVTFLGGSDLMNINDHRIWSNQLWKVTAMKRADTAANLSTVASTIDSRLHQASADVETGHIYECNRESPFRRSFEENGVRYRELGGLYRLRIQDPVAV